MTLRVILDVLGLEDTHSKPVSLLGLFSRYRNADSKNLHRSQIEISIAMLCACLMTLRPLFADLNLILSKLSNRFFSRSKSSSLSHNTSSTELIRGSVSHPQWSDIQESGLKDSTRSRSEGTDTKSGLRIITVGLGATKGKEPLMQV